jgi:hypothetical protein
MTLVIISFGHDNIRTLNPRFPTLQDAVEWMADWCVIRMPDEYTRQFTGSIHKVVVREEQHGFWLGWEGYLTIYDKAYFKILNEE